MAWTEITRLKYQRDGLRYASDTTDEEWAVIEPHMPPPARCGRTRKTSMRDVVNAIFASSLFGMGRNVVVLAWSGGTPYLVTFLGSAESGRFSVPA